MPNNDTARPSFCIIESPYAGANPVAFRRNIAYLHAAMQDCLKRGEVPYASHGFFPGALDDNNPDQRKQGIEAGFKTAEGLLAGFGAFRAIYNDRGISRGMQEGMNHADRIGMLYVPRSLGALWDVALDSEHCTHDEVEERNELLICGDCGSEMVIGTLSRAAWDVAQTYLTKRA